MKITADKARQVAKKIGIDWDKVDFPVEQFRRGIEVEFEHGSKHSKDTDVGADDPAVSGRIAWAHLKELPDYYTRLDKMEAKGEKAMKISEELRKLAKSKCKTPGKKIKSKGKGRGEARGKGEGPKGVPVRKKKAAYDLGVKVAMADAGLTKTAISLDVLKTLASRIGGPALTGAAPGAALGAGVGALGGALSDEGSMGGGALKGLLIGGGLGAGIGAGAAGGATGGWRLGRHLGAKNLEQVIGETGRYAGRGAEGKARTLAERIMQRTPFPSTGMGMRRRRPLSGKGGAQIEEAADPLLARRGELAALLGLGGAAAGGTGGALLGGALSPEG